MARGGRGRADGRAEARERSGGEREECPKRRVMMLRGFLKVFPKRSIIENDIEPIARKPQRWGESRVDGCAHIYAHILYMYACTRVHALYIYIYIYMRAVRSKT